MKFAHKLLLSGKSFDHQQLVESLRRHYGVLPFEDPATYSATPVIIQRNFLAETKLLCRILNDALGRIVQNYFSDERIRKIYDLDEQLDAILQIADDLPYRVGLYRPDFLIDKKGQLKICEIGCRYPLNGWMLSYYSNIVTDQLNRKSKFEWQVVPHQREFVDAIFEALNKDEKLFFVHDEEPGTEIFYLTAKFEKKGLSTISVKPQDFELKAGKITYDHQPATQFILEMDRAELGKFDPGVLEYLIKNGRCFNDVRSLILVHDKRVLAVLYDREIMRDYLSPADYDYLKSFLIPTYPLNNSGVREDLINTKVNWVLKNNSGGRGQDMYIKSNCSADKWQEIITKHWHQYMAQEYVEQESFEIETAGQLQKINIVGMLLYYNKRSFGPGIFRGSADNIINVSGGRGSILPCLIDAS